MAKKTPSKKEDSAFAVISTGGKQYLVQSGDVIQVEKLAGDHKEGDKIVFDQVLLATDGDSISFGTPSVSGKKVEAKFLSNGRAKKVEVVKYKAKSRYLKRNGHKQPFAKVEILGIA